VGLDPFGGSKQSRLLAVPAAQDDSSFRMPSLFQEIAKSARFFQFSDEPTDRVVRSVDPAVVVVTLNDPLIRIGAAGDCSDHVVEGMKRPVEGELQMDFCRA